MRSTGIYACTYTTWRILRFKCHLKRKVCLVVLCTNTVIGSLSFAFAGNGKRQSRFCWQNFCLTSSLHLLVLYISKESK